MLNYLSAQEHGQPVRGSQGRVIGWIVGDTFFKFPSSSEHLLWEPKGWSTDKDVLELLMETGIQWVLIIHQGLGKLFRASLQDHLRLGQFVDRGHGEQLCLELEHWEVESL